MWQRVLFLHSGLDMLIDAILGGDHPIILERRNSWTFGSLLIWWKDVGPFWIGIIWELGF